MNFERRLIAEVKKYECLYNMQALSYKDVAFKDKLWQRVAQKCGTNVEECKKKWKHLRDCFNRCKKRDVQYPKEISGDGKRKVWRYMNQMEFLSPFFNQKLSLQNQEDTGYNESDYADSPAPAQSMQEDVETKLEGVSKIDEATIGNEIMEEESIQDFESEEAEARNTETMFPKFIETTIPSYSNMYSLKTEDDSTTLMFKLLDRKIKQASLTEAQISDMETNVMLFVYKKLAEYKN
ncbi:transcription factor Adf-1-like isoform X1 [Rhagoletis pomonella]|uniref:transcription factor Adf-1-like isoform X1 n=1 Tax=Rhagoletis pomonella TaxID=28610 RepID=UPI00178707D4|nr:transcription factor Adf-1-like isoform X1 [Rhagoletis pomonella]